MKRYIMGNMYSSAKAAMTNGLPSRAAHAKPLQRALMTTIDDLTTRSARLPPTLVPSADTPLQEGYGTGGQTWCGS